MNKLINDIYPLIIWFLLIFIILILLYFIIHPIIITIILIIYTILISINISLWKPNYIFSIIIFLIIISGLIIIFIYFSRLISNEKIIYLNKLLLTIIILLLLIFSIVIRSFNNFIIKSSFIEINPSIKLNIKLFNNIINLYEYPYNYLTILRILFLILCFLIIIKLCTFKSYPIRKLKYDKI